MSSFTTRLSTKYYVTLIALMINRIASCNQGASDFGFLISLSMFDYLNCAVEYHDYLDIGIFESVTKHSEIRYYNIYLPSYYDRRW